MTKSRRQIHVHVDQEAARKRRQDDYGIYRDRMEHEDNLIGQRVNWLVSSQAFLLSPYVFLFLKQFDVAASSNIHRIETWKVSVFTSVLGLAVCLLGFRCCYRVGKSVAGAELSMDRLTYKWMQRYENDDSFEPDISMQRKDAVKGISAPHGLVQSFTKAWAVFFCLDLAAPLIPIFPNLMLIVWVGMALLGLLLGGRLCAIFFDEDTTEIQAICARIEDLRRERQTAEA